MTSLPPAIQAVVALFRGPLAGVRFADVDADGLTSLAAEVESASTEIEAHEAKLVELRQAMAQRHEALLGMAQQALAYARIYAENDEVLSAELAQIALPRANKPRKPTKAAASDASVVESATTEAAPAEVEPAEIESGANVTTAESERAEESEHRLVSKPKKRYSRVPAQTRAS
jgi:hypothetical protein